MAGNFLEKLPAFRHELGVGSGRERVASENHFLACELNKTVPKLKFKLKKGNFLCSSKIITAS